MIQPNIIPVITGPSIPRRLEIPLDEPAEEELLRDRRHKCHDKDHEKELARAVRLHQHPFRLLQEFLERIEHTLEILGEGIMSCTTM